MNKLLLNFTAVFLIFSCQPQTEKQENFPNAQTYFQKIGNAQNRIEQLANMIIEKPQNDGEFYKNDSIMALWGIANEKFLTSFADAYGNVPTDSLLQMFNGYIPEPLVQKIQPSDWETPIGKNAKKQYNEFLKYYDEFNKLIGKPLCEAETTIKALDGTEKDLQKLVADGTFLIDMWASWCAPCRTFNRNFKKQYVAFKDKGIETISISIDKKEKAFEQASKRDQLPWQNYLDANQFLKKRLGVQGVPFQLLVKDGIIVKIVIAEKVEEEILAYINQ
ncbi:TlpA family protein disulfide reductase [Flammeovirga aprica]|uniref:Redoxin domain-containing protein n=1 Tax=Flammeovirga aprica JL-4 TaxID=694437 RepID=A0A7X9XD72_9BACT|nr:thioredoxin-like domain-containing protein [Flammeovirga aprica]NME72344.1 redoxin domain-containing protein [Flammeovirga aprica JL-4]